MHSKTKKTIHDISKWKPGATVYWVMSRPKKPIVISNTKDNEWAFSTAVHPKVLFKRNIIKNSWNMSKKLPMLHAVDFDHYVRLITSEYVVSEFKITQVIRCPLTGECIYQNNDEEWMPESCLFDTEDKAKTEKTRLINIIKQWAESVSNDN